MNRKVISRSSVQFKTRSVSEAVLGSTPFKTSLLEVDWLVEATDKVSSSLSLVPRLEDVVFSTFGDVVGWWCSMSRNIFGSNQMIFLSPLNFEQCCLYTLLSLHDVLQQLFLFWSSIRGCKTFKCFQILSEFRSLESLFETNLSQLRKYFSESKF